MLITRRSFLGHSTLAAAGLGLAGLLPRRAYAQGWGELQGTGWPSPVKILEIFCYSGLSPWENFWVTEDSLGAPDFQHFGDDLANLSWHCPNPPSPVTQTAVFGQDAGGRTIHWGPATASLWNRPDIFSRVRLLALSHNLLPHALAIPLTLTGHRLGHPAAAGLAAAVQHFHMAASPQTVPYAYVIAPDDIQWEFTVGAASANGTHPGFAQPLTVRIGDPSFLNLLLRSHSSADADALMRTYQAVEADHLRYQGADVVRSSAFQSFSHSLDSVFNAPALYSRLTSVNLVVTSTIPCTSAPPLGSPANTPSSALAPNRTLTELDLAVSLLTSGGARYCCVIDRGPDREPGGTPYDLHVNADNQPLERILANNVSNLCTALADRIAANTPGKIDLNDTLILIHSEFGRTTIIDPVPKGRDHWCAGYPAILIGGPMTTRTIGGGMPVVGAGARGPVSFGPGGPADDPIAPTDLRGALMIAAGIDPMAPDNFVLGDFSAPIQKPTGGYSGDEAVRRNLVSRVLGL